MVLADLYAELTLSSCLFTGSEGTILKGLTSETQWIAMVLKRKVFQNLYGNEEIAESNKNDRRRKTARTFAFSYLIH